MTEASSLLVSLPQMVDLALGSPEIGAVNFNLLNAVLQVIIQQMKLGDCTVEFKGPDKDRIHALILTSKPGLSLKITEYQLLDGQLSRRTKRASTQAELEIDDVQPRKFSRDEPKSPKPFTEAATRSPSQQIKKAGDGTSKVVVVEPSTGVETNVENMPRMTVNISEQRFVMLESDMRELKDKMEEILDLPKNVSLMGAVLTPGTEKVTPVNDLWQTLNLSKRVNATEAGVEKLTTMIEDLVRDLGNIPEVKKIVKDPDESRRRSGSIFADIIARFTEIEERLTTLESKRKPSVLSDKGEPMVKTDGDDLELLQNEVNLIQETLKTMEHDLSVITKCLKGKNFADVLKDIEDLKTNALEPKADSTADKSATLSAAQVEELDKKFGDCNEKLNNMDESFSSQIGELQNHLLQIETELGELLERVNMVATSDDVTDGMSLSELYNRFIKLQDDYGDLMKVIQRLVMDQEEKQLIMDSLIEQIEVLKTAKADREDLEDALADKADTQQVNRKVSHDQFDAACDTITRNIEDTMIKLQQQESMWQTTLEEMQTTVGAKLDKQEFDPLRDYVNKKIKSLQQRLKALLAMKEEQEAAGTKSRLLKNVNCISCDKDVVMQRVNQFATMPSPAVMPATRSIRPYITYELDAVRKQQKTLPQGRNFNFLENALQMEKAKAKALAKIPVAHLCNRYCGGSHTTTTAQQRVVHIGHFLNQWGPQAVPLEEGQVLGTDGQIYKAREGGEVSPRKEVVETTKITTEAQTDEPKEQVRRMSSSIEPTGRSKITLSAIAVVRKPARSSSAQPIATIVEEGEEKKDETKEKAKEATPGEEAKERRKSSRVEMKKGSVQRRSTGAKTDEADAVSKSSKRPSTTRKEPSRPSLKQSSRPSLKRQSGAKTQSAGELTKQPSKTSEKESEPPEGVKEEKSAEKTNESSPAESQQEVTEGDEGGEITEGGEDDASEVVPID